MAGAMAGCRAKGRDVALVPAGIFCAVLSAIGRTPPQASGCAMFATVRPVTGLTEPTGVAAVPTGIREMGSVPTLRMAKYRPQVSASVASTVLVESLPPYWKKQIRAL